MTDGERLAILETNMKNIEQKVDDGFTSAKKDNDDLKKLLSDFIEKSEKHFAAKWVETAMWSGIGLVATTLLGSLMALILK